MALAPGHLQPQSADRQFHWVRPAVNNYCVFGKALLLTELSGCCMSDHLAVETAELSGRLLSEVQKLVLV